MWTLSRCYLEVNQGKLVLGLCEEVMNHGKVPSNPAEPPGRGGIQQGAMEGGGLTSRLLMVNEPWESGFLKLIRNMCGFLWSRITPW